jgi:hypothetical protein
MTGGTDQLLAVLRRPSRPNQKVACKDGSFHRRLLSRQLLKMTSRQEAVVARAAVCMVLGIFALTSSGERGEDERLHEERLLAMAAWCPYLGNV